MKTLNNLRNTSAMMGLLFTATLFASCSKESDIRPANPVTDLSSVVATTGDQSQARLNHSTARPNDAMNGSTNRIDIPKPQLDPVSGLGVEFTDAPDIKTEEGKLVSKPSKEVCLLCEHAGGAAPSAEIAVHGFAPIR